jgi:23S rRNA pseudouridine1911/1915/1917 synthase
VTGRYRVGAESQGERLDVYIAAQDLGLSRSQVKRLIEEARVSVNGEAAKASVRLHAGDCVAVEVPPPAPSEAVAEEIPLEVLYEDKDLIVIVKPAGMVVHPAAGVHAGTLVNALLAHCRDLAGVGGTLRPGIVHRLDKGTTGVMVAAKNDAAHAGLARQFKDHSIARRYLALVCGRLTPDRGVIDTLLGRDPRARVRFTSRVRAGRRAVTHFEVRERLPGMTLVALTLETGRTHQIRVHLSERGHPVVGDPTYGRGKIGADASAAVRAAARALGHPMLHAELLGFVHPVTGERLEFRAPLPEDFASFLALARSSGL